MVQSYMPTTGSEVFTADSEKLGSVKEVRDSYFQVNAPMMPDYWLANSDIVDIENGQVRLAFTKDLVGDHKHDEPGSL